MRTFNEDSSLTTKKGWDTVTGRGTPLGLNYAYGVENYLCWYWCT